MHDISKTELETATIAVTGQSPLQEEAGSVSSKEEGRKERRTLLSLPSILLTVSVGKSQAVTVMAGNSDWHPSRPQERAKDDEER